jgi:hypothetical protein
VAREPLTGAALAAKLAGWSASQAEPTEAESTQAESTQAESTETGWPGEGNAARDLDGNRLKTIEGSTAL